MDLFLTVAGIAFIAYVAYLLLTKHGRGRMLGGQFIWSGQEHILDTSEFSNLKELVQVHAIARKSSSGEVGVGIEVRSRSYMHLSVIPISLSRQQALDIAEEILRAAEYSE